MAHTVRFEELFRFIFRLISLHLSRLEHLEIRNYAGHTLYSLLAIAFSCIRTVRFLESVHRQRLILSKQRNANSSSHTLEGLQLLLHLGSLNWVEWCLADVLKTFPQVGACGSPDSILKPLTSFQDAEDRHPDLPLLIEIGSTMRSRADCNRAQIK